MKRWAKAIRRDDRAGQEQVAAIAEELTRRGDLTFLPEMRQMVRNMERAPPESAVWFVLNWGDAEDYHHVLVRSKQEIVAHAKLGDACVWGAAMGDLERLPKINHN